MEEIRTRARLVDPAASSLSTRGLTTLVPRAEVEEAFHRGEFPAPLVLDIARTDGSDDVTAHAQVTVDWDQAMLEELLRITDDDQIRLSFDADELEQALQEAEVDAHGMRERAAVLVIGVAAAGATAGGAFASGPSITPDYAGAPGATVHSTVATDAGSGTESNPLARLGSGVRELLFLVIQEVSTSLGRLYSSGRYDKQNYRGTQRRACFRSPALLTIHY